MGNTTILHGKGRIIRAGGISVFVVADFFQRTLKTLTLSLQENTEDFSTCSYLTLTPEVLFNGLAAARSITNYFVSDKSAVILTDTDKEYLYESTDNAEISVKIRDERVIDLILTTSSDDTDLKKNMRIK